LIVAVVVPSQARDGAGKARGFAEGLAALARALDTMAVELPPAGSPNAGVGEPLVREGGCGPQRRLRAS
jgi:hypothetical protein